MLNIDYDMNSFHLQKVEWAINLYYEIVLNVVLKRIKIKVLNALHIIKTRKAQILERFIS